MMNISAGIVKISELLPKQSLFALSSRLASTQASFKTAPYKLHRLDSGPSVDVTVSTEDALNYYRQMQTLRRLENSVAGLYKASKVRGFCHLYLGQEACGVGIMAAKDPDDDIITSYRCHGWTLMTGSTLTQVVAELLGRRFGNSHGKGGSMHMYNSHFFGGNGIVGAQAPLGAGLALAHKYKNEKNVSFTLFGDGAANQGQLYEVINMCCLWKLPCLFVCENNGYGMGTSAARSSACTEYYTRGDYMPGLWADGMDVLAVRETMKWAKEYCNAGKGPLMIELATYRYSGHSMSDPGNYRTREEIDTVRKTRDPITVFKNKIVQANLVSEDDLKKIDKEIKKEVDMAVAEADKQPKPLIESLYTDVYHNTPPQLIRGVTVDESIVQPFVKTEELLRGITVDESIEQPFVKKEGLLEPVAN